LAATQFDDQFWLSIAKILKFGHTSWESSFDHGIIGLQILVTMCSPSVKFWFHQLVDHQILVTT
jgi:hypothetical protein